MWDAHSLSKVSGSPSIRSTSRTATPTQQLPGGGALREVPIPEEQGEEPHENTTELKWPSGSSVSSTAITELLPSLVDKVSLLHLRTCISTIFMPRSVVHVTAVTG